jgi:D-glycero-alpha-D-manno-heptose-7-phosphate kinase
MANPMMKVRSRAPLRLGLAGGGSDVPSYANKYGGCVLNATVGLYVYCAVWTANETSFRSEDLRLSERHDPTVPLAKLKLQLHHAAHRVLCERFPVVASQNVGVSTFSEVPAGSGLGTSSTVVVAIVDAYRTYFSLPIDEYDLAALAVYIERGYLKQAGGLQDQYAATFGGINFIEFGSERVIVNPLRVRPEIVSEFESHLVMFFSGQSRDSSQIITDQSASVERGAVRLEAMHQVKAESYAMKDALLRGDIPEMANVLTRGWEAKKATSASVSNATINRIYDAAMANGALAGKVSGAGGGGFMFFVVEPENRARICDKLNSMGLVQFLVRFTEAGVQSWMTGHRR